MRISSVVIIVISIILLSLLAFVTVPFDLLDATDVKDYSDTAKFFAGEYAAKHRAAHSVVYGLLLSPYVKMTESFFLLKFASVFWLSLIILSVYYLSKKNRKTLLLVVTAPVVWFLAPWLGPVPLVGLLFLWAHYFLIRFESEEKVKYLICAGLLIGLAATIWDSALYFAPIFIVAFLYDKRFYYTWLFLGVFLVGLAPRLIIDQIIYNFALFSILKNFFALLSFALYGGIYARAYSLISFAGYLILLLFIPWYFFLFYKRSLFVKYKKTMIFITLSLLFILLNTHIRMLILLVPLMIFMMGEELKDRHYRIQVIIFILLSIMVIIPYIMQARYETNARTFEKVLVKFPNITFVIPPTRELIREDLDRIARDYPNEIFVVGDGRDDYKELAHLYWGDGIREFVSIEDYRLFLVRDDIIATQRITSSADPRFRTELWIEVGLRKNSRDDTDYESLRYGISSDDSIDLPDYRLVKKYKVLSVFEKVSSA